MGRLSPTGQLIQDVCKLIAELEHDELEVTKVFLQRLLNGQRLYGKLTKSKKDWAREAFEEFIDAAVYSAAGYIYSTKEEQNQG